MPTTRSTQIARSARHYVINQHHHQEFFCGFRQKKQQHHNSSLSLCLVWMVLVSSQPFPLHHTDSTPIQDIDHDNSRWKFDVQSDNTRNQW
jgi:hypothetical protein